MGKTGSSQDLYDILGVAKDASAQDIKKAFRVLARECHPDVAGTDPKMAEKFKQVREAYEVLSDPVQRARYDRRGERRTNPFYGSMWNRGPVSAGPPPPSPAGGGGRAANDLDLEDIFNDFGVGDFGFTGQTRGQPAGSSARPRPADTGRFRGAAPRSTPRAESDGTDTPGFQTSSFGFGAGARGREGSGREGAGREEGRGGTGTTGSSRRVGPQPGRDIAVKVDVPPEIAARGGTVTVAYTRLRRADDGHTLYRYDELHDLKVPPGMRHGDTLRVANMGDAGLEGGRYGELVVDVRVVGGRAKTSERRGGAWDPDIEGGESATGAFGGAELGEGFGAEGRRGGEGARSDDDARSGDARSRDARSGDEGAPRRDPGRMKMPSRDEPADGVLRVNIGIVEALLGGRVPVETPTGPVRVNIPPGTSSGTRMRLRGRGPVGADGVATDLVAEVRIVVPKTLDAESRRLIERFAELNPTED